MNADSESENTKAEFEQAISQMGEAQYVLRLYLTGTTSRSIRALEMVKALCEEHLKGRYDLEVVDMYQQPDRAESDEIIVAPTLVKELPLPLRRLVGDLSNPDRVLIALNLKTNRD